MSDASMNKEKLLANQNDSLSQRVRTDTIGREEKISFYFFLHSFVVLFLFCNFLQARATKLW